VKRFAATLLLAPLLWACGSVGAPSPGAPALSAGELLAAPTSLALGGVKLRAEATPYLNAPACDGATCVPSVNFVVPVKLRSVGAQPTGAQTPLQASSASSSLLSGLKVTGVYVITEGGVWRSGVASSDSRRCVGTLNCLQAVGRGSASISSSDPVQVVLTFQDKAGKTYKLRDEKAVIDSPR
jgi:hypothetical protein